MRDWDTSIGQVWNPDVRPLVDDAWRCYNVGATRASIVATWSAVVADIIAKLVRLADEGDTQAAPFRADLERAQSQGLTAAGVQAMQAIETHLLAQATQFELIDSIGRRELERIREDRNLCAHPALRTLGDLYEPRPEVARSHLAVALATLLTHPPTQGRKMLDEFTRYICDPLFVDTPAPIQANFFDRARSATRRNIIVVTAKHALLELEPDGYPLPATECADRMAIALTAFAQRDREQVRAIVAGRREQLQTLEGAPLLRVLARLADQDFFWDAVDDGLAARLDDLIKPPVTVGEDDPLPSFTAAAMTVIRSPYARERLPALEPAFSRLSWTQLQQVTSMRPDGYFVPTVIELLRDAASYRSGERAGHTLLRHAPFLSTDTLQAALTAWANNSQTAEASGMPTAAVSLFHATEHLGRARDPLFADFLTTVQRRAQVGSPYTYPSLQAALQARTVDQQP